MMTHSKTPANEKHLARLRSMLAETLIEVLKRGFYGTAGLEVCVQDGTIQHIRRHVEQIER